MLQDKKRAMGRRRGRRSQPPRLKHVKNTGLEVKRNPTSRIPFNDVDVLIKRQYGTQQGRMAYTDAVLRQKIFPRKVIQNGHFSKNLPKQRSLQPPSKTQITHTTSRMSMRKKDVLI